MSNFKQNLSSKEGLPVGRLVMGSLYTPSTTDAEGKPLVYKTGPQTGQPRTNYFFAFAIAKTLGLGWWQETWGQLIYKVGASCFPQACQSPTFAWKIEDGDSTVPNKKGRRPCDNEGWAGHWILKLSGGYAPKVYRQENGGYVQVMEQDFIKCGSYIEIATSVDGNGSQSQPGVYLNHSMVCFRAYGPEITFGPNVEEAGFGQAALPAGASMVPLASASPLPGPGSATAPNSTGVPSAASHGAIPGAPTGAVVLPNPGFVQAAAGIPSPSLPGASAATVGMTPVIPAAPGVTIPASPSSGPQMTAKAGGGTREQFLAQGWSDAQLIAQGYMTI